MSSTAPLIRPLRVDDRPEWARLWRGYLEFYETELPDNIYDFTFNRLLSKDSADPACFVAEEREEMGRALSVPRLIGLVHYLYHAHCWKVRPVCYLQDLFVDPGRRGHRLGQQLIERVYAQATEDGAADVYWMTQEFNSTARRLYDRIGVLTPFIKYRRPA